ncbi:MAG: hypothetical protein GPJ54_04845 [Candidatus Heimdallarchaeota archaeon]|nr:hypothetical protein [Candidatus Heimdallarchaeota archaeon]
MSEDSYVYDVYVIKTSGIPLVSGCTATDYCMGHMGQHELQSGFLAALNSFSQEAFNNEKMRSLEMDNIQLNFKVNNEKELIFATVNPITANKEEIQKKLTKGMDQFIKKFGDKLDSDITTQLMFDEFRPILEDLGLIGDKLMSTAEAQNAENSKKSRLLRWIKKLRN